MDLPLLMSACWTTAALCFILVLRNVPSLSPSGMYKTCGGKYLVEMFGITAVITSDRREREVIRSVGSASCTGQRLRTEFLFCFVMNCCGIFAKRGNWNNIRGVLVFFTAVCLGSKDKIELVLLRENANYVVVVQHSDSYFFKYAMPFLHIFSLCSRF